MLSREVCAAVEQGLFQIHSASHVSEGAELLLGHPFGADPDQSCPIALPGPACRHASPAGYPADSILGRAEATLQAFRRACLRASNPKAWRRR
jgi:hypothetical protein